MPVNNGYLIPDDPSPSNNRCVRVYVPNDPLYMAALLGALTYLGQWTAWERDALHRGVLAADSWKDANDLTLDGLSFPCSDNPITDDEMSEILEQLAEIRSQLAEINEMNVTQTVNVGGCGCCDDESTTTQTTSGSIDPQDTGIIPPYNTDPIEISDYTKCRSTNYLAAMVTETIRALSGRLGGGVLLILGITEVLIAILSWIDLVPGDEVVGSVIGLLGLITIAQAIARMAGTTVFTWGVLDELAEILEVEFVAESFVCALSGWTNSQELGASLSLFINSRIDELSTDDFVKDAMKDVFSLLFDSPLINWFVENAESVVPADFVAQYDCLCGATGDSCPTQNIVLAGVGSLPSIAGDLSGTTQGFGSSFNSKTGYYEVILELADNYCVTIDNATYSPIEEHEKCSGGVMVPSDGSCIRRFVARSQTPFGTAVTFVEQSVDCTCDVVWGAECLGANEFVDLASAIHDTTNDRWNDGMVLNEWTVTGNRVTIDFTRPASTTGDKGIWFNLLFEHTGIVAWAFDNVDISFPDTLEFVADYQLSQPQQNMLVRAVTDFDLCAGNSGLGYDFVPLRAADYSLFIFVTSQQPHDQNIRVSFDVRGIRRTP